MARPPTAADEVRALAAVAEAEGKPCVLPDELIARLEAEARTVLAEVEPMHSMKERRAEREERAYGNVLYDYDPERGRVVFAEDDWRPRATRTPSGWTVAGGWLDEPVPELPKLPARSKSTPRLFVSDGPRVAWPRQKGRRRATGTWRDRREAIREWPLPIVALTDFQDEAMGRGWCSGLAAATTWFCEPGTAAGWAAMQRAHDRAMRTTDAAWAAGRAEIVRAKGEGT